MVDDFPQKCYTIIIVENFFDLCTLIKSRDGVLSSATLSAKVSMVEAGMIY